MKIITIIFLSIFTSQFAKSQFTEQWIKKYNGPGNYIDQSVSLAVDDLKNIYVAGSSFGNGTEFDFAVIKYNSSGMQDWVSRFNGSGNNTDILSAMTIDNQGNVYVTGITYTFADSYDYATIKYNSSGAQQWASFYNGTGGGIDNSQAIITDGSGNVYVTGYSYGGSGTSYDFATIKYNSSGIQQWAVRYNGPGNGSDEPKAIAIDGSQNIYVTGKAIGSGGVADFATVKYNSSGVRQWVALYNGPASEIDISHAVKIDVSGNVIVTGYSRGTSGTYDYETIKYDSDGNQLWERRYNGTLSANDIPTALACDNSGNVYVTGVTNNTGGLATQSNYATIKYNSSGAPQWTAIYDGTGNGNDSATSISLNSSGEVYVTGKSMGTGSSFDFATIKYSTSGAQDFVSRFNGTGNSSDVANCIKVDDLGNTYVTGSVSEVGTSEDFGTIKYSKMTGLTTISSNIPENFSLNQNFPNPFNPSTNIIYSLKTKSLTRLKVYSISGNEVAVLVNQNQEPGTYSVFWNSRNLSSGIYYCKLETENFSDTKKMILLK